MICGRVVEMSTDPAIGKLNNESILVSSGSLVLSIVCPSLPFSCVVMNSPMQVHENARAATPSRWQAIIAACHEGTATAGLGRARRGAAAARECGDESAAPPECGGERRSLQPSDSSCDEKGTSSDRHREATEMVGHLDMQQESGDAKPRLHSQVYSPNMRQPSSSQGVLQGLPQGMAASMPQGVQQLSRPVRPLQQRLSAVQYGQHQQQQARPQAVPRTVPRHIEQQAGRYCFSSRPLEQIMCSAWCLHRNGGTLDRIPIGAGRTVRRKY